MDPISYSFKARLFHHDRINITDSAPTLGAQMVKNTPAMWETWVRSLGWEDALEEGRATHSSILVWRIPIDREAWQATYHPWGCKESDTTELKHRTSSHLTSHAYVMKPPQKLKRRRVR